MYTVAFCRIFQIFPTLCIVITTCALQNELSNGTGDEPVVLRRRTKSDGHKDSPAMRETRMLDAEVVDTLYQLDSVVSELERSTLLDGPSPIPQSSPATTRKISPSNSSLNSIEQPSPSSELSSSLDSVTGMKTYPSPPRVRALPNVNQLKQQFLSPQRPSSAPLHREGKPDDLMLVRGNVKNIVAQMQITTTQDVEQPRSLTPPVVSDQVRKRHSVVIQSKISEINQQWIEQKDDKKERRKSQSYTPPSRRKIQSPFLLEEFKIIRPEDIIAKVSSQPITRAEFKSETQVVLPAASKEEEVVGGGLMEEEKFAPPTQSEEDEMKKEEESEKVLSPARTREEFNVESKEEFPASNERENEIEEPLPPEGEIEVKQKEIVLSPNRTRERSPLIEELMARTREKSPMKEEVLTTPSREKPPVEERETVGDREKSPTREEPGRTNEELPIQEEELVDRDRAVSPPREGIPSRRKAKSPTPLSLQECEAETEDLTSKGENHLHQALDDRIEIETTTSRDNVHEDVERTGTVIAEDVNGGAVPQSSEERDHQATVMDTSPSSAGTEKSSDESHLTAFTVLSPPHKKSPSRKKPKMELPSQGDVATPDDVELTFDEATSTSTLESDRQYEGSRKDSLFLESPHRVDIVIGMKENGIFTPPRIVEDEERPPEKLTSQYDHLPNRSQYDHLAPLEPGEDPYKPFQRPRSASDVASHHIQPRASRHKRNLDSSEVSSMMYRRTSIEKRALSIEL